VFACFSDFTGGRDSIAVTLPLEVEVTELFESVLVVARAGAKDGEVAIRPLGRRPEQPETGHDRMPNRYWRALSLWPSCVPRWETANRAGQELKL